MSDMNGVLLEVCEGGVLLKGILPNRETFIGEGTPNMAVLEYLKSMPDPVVPLGDRLKAFGCSLLFGNERGRDALWDYLRLQYLKSVHGSFKDSLCLSPYELAPCDGFFPSRDANYDLCVNMLRVNGGKDLMVAMEESVPLRRWMDTETWSGDKAVFLLSKTIGSEVERLNFVLKFLRRFISVPDSVGLDGLLGACDAFCAGTLSKSDLFDSMRSFDYFRSPLISHGGQYNIFENPQEVFRYPEMKGCEGMLEFRGALGALLAFNLIRSVLTPEVVGSTSWIWNLDDVSSFKGFEVLVQNYLAWGCRLNLEGMKELLAQIRKEESLFMGEYTDFVGEFDHAG